MSWLHFAPDGNDERNVLVPLTLEIHVSDFTEFNASYYAIADQLIDARIDELNTSNNRSAPTSVNGG